ncbi:hypothetical protein JCM1840_003591 [Sporobolomyces johnsonii]
MRQKRVKSYRKVMQLFQAAFGFREPYQLLVDAAFLQSCVQQKLEFLPRLQDVLQGAVKPMITQCCIQALYDAGPEGQAAVDMAKGFERRKCNHFKPRPQDECMAAMAGDDNKNRYVFATQSLELRQTLRKVPGTPIVYIARSVVLLETPSDQTLAKKTAMESAKLHAPAAELALLSGQPLPAPASSDSDSDSDAADTTTGAAEPPTKKKKRGPKGPNPLSVKKKKKQAPTPGSRAAAGKKRPREDAGGEVGERKRKRDDPEGTVVSMAARGAGAGGGGGGGEGGGEARKKRKRRKKGGAAAGAAGGEGGADGARGGTGPDE